MTARRTSDRVLTVAFAIVAVVAGVVGVVMLAAPGSTGDYFSWALGPPPLATLVGGLYVASTVVFGLAIGRTWGEVRGLVAGVLGLTLPTLTATLVHTEVFDFSRPVAVIWLVLFVASPATYGTILLLRRHEPIAGGAPLPAALRAALGGLAALLMALAVLAWVDRRAVEELVPFALAPMGGAFLGAWALFLAVLAGWAAGRGGRDEARIPLVGLLAYAVGAIAAALRSWSDLADGRRVAYLLALAAVAVLAAIALRARAPSTSAGRAGTEPAGG